MYARSVEVYPALVTEAVLDFYAQYLVARAASSHSDDGAGQGTASTSQEVPQSLEEALAPLEVLYGKTALSAIGIALHGAEPVIRYVEEINPEAEHEREKDDRGAVDEEEEVTSDDEEGGVHVRMAPPASREATATDLASPSSFATQDRRRNEEPHVTAATVTTTTLSQQARQRGRCLYHVGEHTLFSPYYCPCSAYAYQSIQRQEVWCCKHLLALQLALRVEATGLPQENLRDRIVPAAEFTQLLSCAL
ncbi:hypothetical protein ABB37_03984 [Leptomonas pyrrhocoris]|uniref:SWIM-type domain-containing protein n=1 Tax=Leptomonas pyrrhocoris TaxID=157538 RepID=A0A0M9G3L8_LEPPY|nr:hypothetical protein ABB37_03984 [Leptomonas pyrrhocoris]XP_015660115.1 hypothetical protein ABB37_03984 [Leptomonas pyrrhocoris]KPA81675.1 hypothetical protein ABB37_03984 [Leptomonas pyrrhocoris]KPA81676.1 hypothetical protein ABB37_03984 [Leptomonas pyrrhocoris]|eukprot:XP_015660114.1 hypothetical protein ABB37_03984 [Leptomonas pyrrhocoris]